MTIARGELDADVDMQQRNGRTKGQWAAQEERNRLHGNYSRQGPSFVPAIVTSSSQRGRSFSRCTSCWKRCRGSECRVHVVTKLPGRPTFRSDMRRSTCMSSGRVSQPMISISSAIFTVNSFLPIVKARMACPEAVR